MHKSVEPNIIPLDVDLNLWDNFFTVAPLVIVGSKEGEGYDLAPKHMALPMGWKNYFGFICTPRHSTYHNIKEHKCFTITYPKADQLLITSLTASPRDANSGEKSVIDALETWHAKKVDGLFLKDGYLYFECELFKIVDDFGVNSLITGKIIAAYLDKDYKRVSTDQDQQLLHQQSLLAYLYPGRFAIISDTLAFPFPKNFKK